VFTYCDGGRAAAGYKGKAGDCVTRAIAIAAEQDYQIVYEALHQAIKRQRGKRGSPRDGGANKATVRKYIAALGWRWVPTMQIGSGCKVHLRAEELPKGRLIVQCSGHLTAMIDGVIWDTYDPSREGTRCVYGYWVNTP
jgi:hypothetical protein